MKKPIFEDCSFNFNHNGCFYNVKFIQQKNGYYKIIVQDWNDQDTLYESEPRFEIANKTTALRWLCLALKIS